jgi:hypothetical protein
MPEPRDPLALRMRALPGLATLLAEAERTWRDRAAAAGAPDGSPDGSDSGADSAKPGWRTFEDAFPTFYEFTNRPR